MLAPLLFNTFFAAVINKRGLHAFQGGPRHHGCFGTPEEEKGGVGLGGSGESVLATPLWGMLYADDAVVVSQSPEQLRKIMGVILVVVCAAFGLEHRSIGGQD